MIADTTVSLVTYFVGKYLNPEAAKDILFLIGAIQPVWLMVIGFIGLQNVAGIKADGALKEAKMYAKEEVEQAQG